MKKYEVLEEQFTLLFNSIETISNAKNLEDKYEVQINYLKQQLSQQSSDTKILRDYVNDTTKERDEYRKSTKQLLEAKQKITNEKHTMQETFKKKMAEIDRDLKKKIDEEKEAYEKN